jgi:hypothetical protein
LQGSKCPQVNFHQYAYILVSKGFSFFSRLLFASKDDMLLQQFYCLHIPTHVQLE